MVRIQENKIEKPKLVGKQCNMQKQYDWLDQMMELRCKQDLVTEKDDVLTSLDDIALVSIPKTQIERDKLDNDTIAILIYHTAKKITFSMLIEKSKQVQNNVS